MANASPANAQSYAQTCEASYYGYELAGNLTASGEIFNPELYTAASLTLPLGSYATVTNLYTGQSVTVKINDRGPFIAGRCVDLSLGAARAIGLEYAGVRPVVVAPASY